MFSVETGGVAYRCNGFWVFMGPLDTGSYLMCGTEFQKTIITVTTLCLQSLTIISI